MKFDNFKPHGAMYQNGAVIEIEISKDSELARYRMRKQYHSKTAIFNGYWQPIRFNKKSRAYIRDWHNYSSSYKKLYLDEFVRI